MDLPGKSAALYRPRKSPISRMKAQQQISGPLVVVLCVRQKNTRNIER
jgi:hypothetical protein